MIDSIMKSYIDREITITEYYDLVIKCEILNALININEVLDEINKKF